MCGWIKLHRSMLDWEWYDDPNTMRVFLHCLLKANHTAKKWRGIEIKRGQFLSSYEGIGLELKLSRQKVRTAMEKLKSTNEVTSQSNAQSTMFTVVAYDSYQEATNESTNDQPASNQRITNEQPTSNQRATTTKNDKKEKKEKNVNNDKKEIAAFSGNQDAVIVLNYMNDCLDTKYKSTGKTNMGFINARLRDHSVDDLKLVINHKIKEWGNSSKWAKYLRPQTLFQESKFEGYLMDAKMTPLIQESENQFSEVTRQNIENLRSWGEDFTNDKR